MVFTHLETSKGSNRKVKKKKKVFIMNSATTIDVYTSVTLRSCVLQSFTVFEDVFFFFKETLH